MNGNSNGKKKRRKRIIIIGIVAAVLLVFAGALFAFTRGGTKIDPTKLAKVDKGDLAKSVVATGKVTPITKVEVKSKASGIVTRLDDKQLKSQEPRPRFDLAQSRGTHTRVVQDHHLTDCRNGVFQDFEALAFQV